MLGDLSLEWSAGGGAQAAGSDEAKGLPADGLAIWHVDARLDANGTKFLYDNSQAPHKLLELMEADGRNDIEDGSGEMDAGDLYTAGKSLTPSSRPNSKSYDKAATGVRVTGVGAAGDVIPVTAAVGAGDAVVLADPQRAGYHVAIKGAGGAFVCSGALVRGDTVLTAGAGPCPLAPGSSQVWLRPPSPGPAQAVVAKHVVPHPSGDLQLVFLEDCAASARPVVLAPSESSYYTYRARDWMVTGWQTLGVANASPSANLTYTYVRYSKAPCAAARAGQICAAARPNAAGPCAGDYGSPLVYNTDGAGTAPASISGAALAKDVLAGVAVSRPACAAASSPAVFASVGGSSSRAWIARNLQARPSPCWAALAALSVTPVTPSAGLRTQAWLPPPGQAPGGPGAYEPVEAPHAAVQRTVKCRLRELYGGGCKAFSIYSANNLLSGGGCRRRALLGVLDPPPAEFCVFYEGAVPELCGNETAGHCANAVGAYRAVWSGA